MINLENRHPSVRNVAQFFTWEHLPEHLQAPSKIMAEALEKILDTVPEENAPAELVSGIRKMLEAKDCFVRAYIPK